MPLRLKINAIVGALTLLFVICVMWLQWRSLRESVQEEVVAANRVAVQMLTRTVRRDEAPSAAAVLAFLQGIGRVRSTEIALFNLQGRALYRSPPSEYKRGRSAPMWFTRLVAQPAFMQAIELPDGKLFVQSNSSRAVLDAWDSVAALAAVGLALFLVANALIFWLVGRAVRPLGQIAAAMDNIKAGGLETSILQLPPLPGAEAAAIGVAFNRMLEQLQAHAATERRAVRAESQLSDSRELAQWVDQHIERERHMIARELHDELGQSVTAMRSLALFIAQRIPTLDRQAEEAAQLIADEASRLYDAMHGIIPRLTPLVLDSFGLGEALADLADRTRRSQPGVQIELRVELGTEAIASDTALALYRVAQEGFSNALRHGQAQTIRLVVKAADGALTLTLTDDGRGLPPDASQRAGHHGLRWLAERVESIGGSLHIKVALPTGVALQAWLPLSVPAVMAKAVTL